MSASDPLTHRSLTLPNGLRVVLCSTPRLKRCAAALRVAAGSHDVPAQWPGLAHFLEHLFFLGTERFPSGQNLMTYVQRHGGQVNASTRERTTDFFFELAPAAFADGLDRLCEMLAHPRMAMADQLREREVLHAEFIAWSRDDASRDQLKRLQPLSPYHPLRWFHAGNRFSLPVPRPAFQQALLDFYQAFYQAGQMTLSLAGPLPLDELQALAVTYGGYFTPGRRIDQVMPPVLVDKSVAHHAEAVDQQHTHLLFACEELPPGHDQAAAFLCTWINNTQAGGLVAELRQRGLIDSLKAEVVYEFGGQALIDIEAVLTDAIAGKRAPPGETRSVAGARSRGKLSDPRARISGLVFNWLSFFKTHYPQLLNEYTLLEQRRLAVSGAMSLARHYSAEAAGSGLSALAIHALDALLDSLTPQTLLQPLSQMADRESFSIDWRLPAPNPFLHPASAPMPHVSPLPSFTFSDDLPANGEAIAYVRWTLVARQPKLALMLGDGLKALIANAQQAGVSVTFTAYGDHWQLKLSGLAEPLPVVLEQAMRLLGNPEIETLARYGQPSHEPAPIPIRQLLKTLPDHYLNSAPAAETNDLPRVWEHARWIGFATGLKEREKTTLIHAMRTIPGKADEISPQPPAQSTAKRWQTEPSASGEDAVLVFYPTPTTSVEDEAVWRFFSHLLQAPFYQRLRVELQLGYAVFSGYRQLAGQGGLLFGVQSPSASAERLVEHIETFIRTLPALIENADLPAQINALRDQLDFATMDSQQAAETLWQAHLAGHTASYPERLQHSLAHLQLQNLVDAASRITQPESPCFCLSNRSGAGEASHAVG